MTGDDPACPTCGTVYNRGPVIRELQKIDPLIFQFATWTTKFRCQRCGTAIAISGSKDELDRWLAQTVEPEMSRVLLTSAVEAARSDQENQDAAAGRVQNYGAGLVVAGGLALFLGSVTALVILGQDEVVPPLLAVPTLIVAPGVACVFVGRSLQSYRSRVLGILLAVLFLPILPIGTIFGGYGLCALGSPTARRLFQRKASEAGRDSVAPGDLDDLPGIARLSTSRPWWQLW